MAARKKSEEPSINIDEVLTDEELKAVANESEPAERKAKPEDGPRTVVVAEDEAVNRMDLVAMLEDNGYEVVGQAANGEEAVELTRKYRLMWCAWMSRCRVWTASPLPALSAMKTSPPSSCSPHSPRPIW